MTGAGGVSSGTGLTQIRFAVGGETFGPMPAAVQDIGALPSSLDGIIGLSWLSQFAGVEFDFEAGKVLLFRTNMPPSSKSVLASASMQMVPRLGIYTVDVRVGGRGPVRMLVDSGAASTMMNWQGVSDLGLSRSSPQLRSLSQIGAMGSDNIAIALTHRLGVSSRLELGNSGPGLDLSGKNRMEIDIGAIPVIDGLDGVGGILGIDAMLRCSAVRFQFRNGLEMTMLQ